MKGIVEVFQVKNGCWNKTYEDDNMVVHGGKTSCADIFTHLPLEREDGTYPLTDTAVESVSNYTINSLTLGAGQKTLSKRDSRHAVKYLNDLWGANTAQYLDISGNYYALLPYRENFKFQQFANRGNLKNSANSALSKKYKGPSLHSANVFKHSSIEVTLTEEDGGSLTFEKIRGQDFAEVTIPIHLDLATDYKVSLGVDGNLPVKIELIRVDKITRLNSLSVNLREHVWDFTQAGFVEGLTVADKSRLEKTLHTSGVIAGELHEIFFSTAFDKIDQGGRVELFDYSVKITAPQATDFEKGKVRLHNFKLESLDEAILQNPTFNRVESLVDNTSFKDLTPYDITDFTGGNPEDLRIMGVYQIGGYEHHSAIYASSNALDASLEETPSVGWVSLDNVDAYGTSSRPPKASDGNESNIGVSFNSKSFLFDNVGAATLTKRFKFPKKWTDFYTQTGSRFEQGYLNDPYSRRNLVIKFDCNPVSSVLNGAGGAPANGVKIRCANVTKGLNYNFVAGDLYESKSWGGSGTPQVLGAGLAMNTTTTLQANITMPLEFYNDEFKLDIIGHAGRAEDDAGRLTIRNLDIGQLEGWNINEGYASGVTVSSCAGTPVSGLRIITDAGQSPAPNWYEVSSSHRNTFISQTITGLDPNKIYNLIIEGKSNTGTSKVGVALIHKGYSDPYTTNHAKYFTIGDLSNTGNAFQNYFNPDTAVSGMGFTVPGPKGPPSSDLADTDYEEHQKCVRWQRSSIIATPQYEFTGGVDYRINYDHPTYVNLPNGRFSFKLDLRHIHDVADPYPYYYPVQVSLKMPTPPTWTYGGGLNYWYNFRTRVWMDIEDSEAIYNLPDYRKIILPGSHALEELEHVGYPNVAKSTFALQQLKGDPDGWHTASVDFDLRESDFGFRKPRKMSKPESDIRHTEWSTRPVEFYFHIDPTLAGGRSHDNSGTVYIKNAKLVGPPTPREPLNTYHVYKGGGVWAATSSLSSVDTPISGHRPRRDASAGTETWNEIGSMFAQNILLNDTQQSISIFGMNKFFNKDAPYGNNEIYGEGNGSIASSMWSAEKESVYELMLFHTVGSDLEIHNVTLTDAATTFFDGPSSHKKTNFTSEPFVESHYLTHPGGWSVDFKQKTSGGITSDTPPKITTFTSGLKDSDTYLRLQNTNVGRPPVDNYHTTFTNYCDTVENFGMTPGARYAFAFDHASIQNTISEGVLAQWDNTVYWLSGTGNKTQWVPTSFNNQTPNPASYRAMDTFTVGVGQYKEKLTRDYVTPEFVLPTNIPAHALIGIKIKERPQHRDNWNSIKNNFRAYRVCNEIETSSVIPNFPEEQDYTVQPLTEASSPGEFGHFQNAIEFYPASGTAWDYHASTTAHIPTYEKAIHLGAYLPGSGLDFSSGAFGIDGVDAANWGTQTTTFSGTLNKFSTVTPKGHILRHTGLNTHGNWLLDSSAGLTVSGPFDDTGATDLPANSGRVVKYALTLTRAEVEYLTYYSGGIETAGLWTVNYAESAKKKHYKYGSPPFLVSGTGVPYDSSLYNLKDYEEPDWSLFAKKVFLAGGLKMHADSEYLTIIWSLKF